MTVRAFRQQERFQLHLLHLLDSNQRVSFITSAISCWLTVRLQLLGIIIITFLSVLSVLSCGEFQEFFSHQQPGLLRTSRAALLGLSLSYALPIVNNLTGLIGSYTETEKEMISVER